MSQKIGRNDPCWCDSGLKYKKCHLNREAQPKTSINELIEISKKMKNSKGCYVLDQMKSECVSEIVKAHTVPLFSLKKIAVNGHVYGLKQSIDPLLKKGHFTYEKVGINTVTTFTGFCKHHDNILFEDIEKTDFVLNEKTSFLLLYRAYAREYYCKLAAKSNILDLKKLDKGKSEVMQVRLQNFINLHNKDIELSLRDIDIHRKEYFEMLQSGGYENMRSVSFNMLCPPPVMCSGLICPNKDIDGNSLQNLSDHELILDEVTVTSFFDGRQGRVVFSWSKSSDLIIPRFIKSFLNKDIDIVLEYIFQYILQNFENLAISPAFWEGLTVEKRHVLNAYISPLQNGHRFDHSLKLINFSCSDIEKINVTF